VEVAGHVSEPIPTQPRRSTSGAAPAGVWSSSPHPGQAGERKIVTDAVGTTWRTGDIYETSALVTIYGMFFIAVLALLRTAQQRAAAPALTTEVKTTKRANPARLSG
jgi:hypothetical protein